MEKVQEALSKEPRVCLTHINTPRQVVIGGDPQACQRVIGFLHCASLRAPFDYALHCAPMRSEYGALADLHNYPVEHNTRLRLYSAAEDAPLRLDQQEIAHKMAHMLTSPLDFPRLVQKVYSDGARVFIEAGAGSNCTRWIGETLKGKPHLALSMNRRGTDDYHTLVRMAARLFSHRVPLESLGAVSIFSGGGRVMNNQSRRTFSREYGSHQLAQLVLDSLQRSSQVHQNFLNQRRSSLTHFEQLIELQIGSSLPVLPARKFQAKNRQAVFDNSQLDEFGTGSISRCFGSAFSHYDARRIPRIPNGDLKMMNRVVDIRGSLSDLRQPAEIEVEYDVPVDAWYLHDSASVELPYSLLMEIALQPCGFLSAYLDTYALVPYEFFYFRNLDGVARVVETVDVRGKMLSTRARLLSSVSGGGTVIQKFSFTVSCETREIYQGESTFGYFSDGMMSSQAGLDGGLLSQPWIKAYPATHGEMFDLDRWRSSDGQRGARLPAGRLGLLDQVFISPQGGQFSKGYVYAQRPVNPQDWFYRYHFFGDPVMPGSLGVEAAHEMIKAYSLAHNVSGVSQPAGFSLPAVEQPTSWRYRGQITPLNKMMELEVHLKGMEQRGSSRHLMGDASIWIDGLRIYEVKNVAVRSFDQNR